MTEWLKEPTAAYHLRTPTDNTWTSSLESALGDSFDGKRSVRNTRRITLGGHVLASVFVYAWHRLHTGYRGADWVTKYPCVASEVRVLHVLV